MRSSISRHTVDFAGRGMGFGSWSSRWVFSSFIIRCGVEAAMVGLVVTKRHGGWPSREAWSAQALRIFLVKLVIKVGASCLLVLRLID